MRKIYILTFILTLLYSITAIGQPDTGDDVLFPGDLNPFPHQFSFTDTWTPDAVMTIDGSSVAWYQTGFLNIERGAALTNPQRSDGSYLKFTPRSVTVGAVENTTITSETVEVSTTENVYLWFDWVTDFRRNDFVDDGVNNPNPVQGYDVADITISVSVDGGLSFETVWKDDHYWLEDPAIQIHNLDKVMMFGVLVIIRLVQLTELLKVFIQQDY